MREVVWKALRNRMQEVGIDVYVGVTPANFHYVSGFQSPFLELSWQMTGTDLVVFPADENLQPILIVSEYAEPFARQVSDITDIRTYPMWTEGRSFELVSSSSEGQTGGFVDRPIQFDSQDIFTLLKNALNDRGLATAKIGTDLGLMKQETWQSFVDNFGESQLVDFRNSMYAVRAIKQDFEIERIRRAAKLFDAGVGYCAAEMKVGQQATDLRELFHKGVSKAVDADSSLGPIESSFVFEHIGKNNGAIASGDIVKLDCGVKVDGYWSDGCRHFCMGEATPNQTIVHKALLAGFEAAEVLIRSGATCRSLYEAALEGVRSNGLPFYSRGHFGHSIGLDDHQEEPPFLGPCDDQLEAGMIICLEVPYYPSDVGGFNIEDMYLVTTTGYERLTHLPRDLIALG